MHARSGLLLAATAALAAALAIATRSPATPAGSNGAIAFQRYAGSREDDSTSQVFVRSPAGAIRQLTKLSGGSFDPAWSPDGSRIVFERWGVRTHQPDQLYTIGADGGGLRKLVSGCTRRRCLGDDWGSYSPDGRQIAFVRAYKPLIHKRFNQYEQADFPKAVDLMVVSAKGGAPRVVRHFSSDPLLGEGGLAWSPDGSRIAFALGTLKHPNKHTHISTALFVANADGSGQRMITPWALGAANPDWAPDGSRIAFNSEGGHSPNIYAVRPDGSGLRRLLAGNHRGGVGPASSPTWSPDGTKIVFTAPPKLGSYIRTDVYVMNADGRNVQPLVASPRMETNAAWQRLP
jgi:Tol biopolymer transport system component